jgi:hypothetical protein
VVEALITCRGASLPPVGLLGGGVAAEMAEELEVLCRRLHLSDREKLHTRLRQDPVAQSHLEAKHSLLFKLLSTRPFNGMALLHYVRSLWASPNGMTIREIEDNLFMAVFQVEADLERIIVQSPWTFDKKLIHIVRLVGDIQPREVKFQYSAFWIHILNLPIKSMIREVGEDIGNGIGRFIEADVPEDGIGWGRYLRIRVDIDISLPLFRGKILEGVDGSPFWVDFQYEHLPTFCYQCGLLGHGGSEFIVGRGLSDKMVDGASDLYGSWLRAPPHQKTVSSRNRVSNTASAPLRRPHVAPARGNSRSSDSVPVGVFSFTARAKVVNNPVSQEPDSPKSMPGVQGGDNARSPGLDANGFKPVGFQVDDTMVGESQLFHAKTKGFGTSACGESFVKKTVGSDDVGESSTNISHAPVAMPPVSTPGGTPLWKSKVSPHHPIWARGKNGLVHKLGLVFRHQLGLLEQVKDLCRLGNLIFMVWA